MFAYVDALVADQHHHPVDADRAPGSRADPAQGDADRSASLPLEAAVAARHRSDGSGSDDYLPVLRGPLTAIARRDSSLCFVDLDARFQVLALTSIAGRGPTRV